jgi:hypothetical protein
MPFGVIDTKQSEVQLLIPPLYSLMVFLPPLYNQLSNEQGLGVENLFFSYSLIREVLAEQALVFL